MFHIIEKKQTLVKGIMIAVILSFVLWGVGNYLGMSSNENYVAKVGNTKIYPQQIDQVIEQNPRMTDKMQILTQLVNRQLLLNHAKDSYIVPTKQELQDKIASFPEFQTNGSFDINKFKTFLNNSNITVYKLQKDVHQQIILQQVIDLFQHFNFSSNKYDLALATLLSSQRSVSTYTVDYKQFIGSSKLSSKEISDYYNANTSQYTIPAQVKVQYLTLSKNDIINSIKITPEELDSYVKHHLSDLQNKQIDVSHILFMVPSGADATTKAQIKAKAEEVLQLVKAHPDKFAGYAKQYSQDPISAKNGGDLGFFSKGTMVPAFDKVAFSLKPSQISGIVETRFGFHILKLNAIKEVTPEQIDQVATMALQKEQANKVILQQENKLNDITYSQPTSLSPAAKALNLTIQNSDWINQNTQTGNFANPKILSALFSDDALKNHNNTPVINLGNDTYAVYHVTAYKPSSIKPLDMVKNDITALLQKQKAISQAKTVGLDELTQIRNGKVFPKFSHTSAVTILPTTGNQIAPDMLKQIFSTKIPAKSSAYIGNTDMTGNFIIYKISDQSIDKSAIAKNLELVKRSQADSSMLLLDTYIKWLQDIYKVNYNLKLLNNQNNQ